MTMQSTIKPAAISARINAIRRRHGRLNERVAAEHGRPAPDMAALQKWKREKLRLKDELVRYEGLMRTLERGQRAH